VVGQAAWERFVEQERGGAAQRMEVVWTWQGLRQKVRVVRAAGDGVQGGTIRD
jgi:hypothetical protein